MPLRASARQDADEQVDVRRSLCPSSEDKPPYRFKAADLGFHRANVALGGAAELAVYLPSFGCIFAGECSGTSCDGLAALS